MKGIILAGGRATRLYPITKSISKQLLPVYDKPMIYYPLSVLMLAGIRDILVISTPESLPQFQNLLGDGNNFGVRLQYVAQDQPRGLADAFIVGERFIAGDRVALILGDNIFFGDRLYEALIDAQTNAGATIFSYYVRDPENFGVINFDREGRVISIEEKPENPQSHWAITGLYFFDAGVVDIAGQIKPSARGELEITDVIREYHRAGRLRVSSLGRGYAWLDTGNYSSLIDAAIFIKTIEDRQGLKIGCIEEVAFRMGFIDGDQLAALARGINTSYGEYLLKILKESRP
jgi:glucose-1-phosphate thymidylyltransferase